MDRYWKKVQAMLLSMAREDPNGLIRHVYESGMSKNEIAEISYIIDVARRSRGYQKESDLLVINSMY